MLIPIFYRKTDTKGNLLLGAQFLLMLPMVGLAAVGLYSDTWLLAGADTALSVLKGYLAWYRIMLWGGLAITALAALMHAAIFKSLKKTDSSGPQHVYMAVLCMAIICIFTVIMVYSEGVPNLIANAKADISAIKRSQLVSTSGQVALQGSEYGLRGPYREGRSTPLVMFVLSPDGQNPSYIYAPKASALPSGSGAYEVLHTPKFLLAVEFRPVGDN
ncbi:MAG: hypothetical protein FWG30_08165 [Eubacteriaceae bacterium]|jgi:hypothetical protein|nr:hypothetical protein [Eubacteriaceae bacterium]